MTPETSDASNLEFKRHNVNTILNVIVFSTITTALISFRQAFCLLKVRSINEAV